jgi:hypothetical protein
LYTASLLFPPPLPAQTGSENRLNVSGFGAKGDGRTNDLPAIQKAIDAAILKGPGTVVVIPSGRFRLIPADPQQRSHLELRRAHGITITGNKDSVLDCSDPKRDIFRIQDSSGITISSLKLERHPFVFTQGTIQTISAADKTVEAVIDPGYDEPDSTYMAPLNFLMIFAEPATRTWYHDAAWPPEIMRRERLDGGRWRFTLSRTPDPIYAGKPFAIWRNVYGGWGFAMADSENIRIQDVAYYPGGGQAGFVVNHCEGDISFLRFSVTVAPGSGQRFASAGGAMVFNNRIRLTVDDCDFAATDDDNINMGTNSSHVIAQDGPRTLRIESGRDRADYRPGDRVELWDWVAKKARLEAKVVSVSHDKQWDRIVLDRDVKAGQTGVGPLAEFRAANPKGDIHPSRRANEYDGIDRIVNLDDVGTAVIRNSRFQSLRARNLLIKSSDTLIENNVFHDTVMASILAGPEFYWDEGPAVRHLVIRNNRFEDISGSGIFVAAHTTQSEFPQPNGHAQKMPESLDNRDITIEGNTFVNYGHYQLGVAGRPGAPIYLRNVDGAVIRNNTIGPPDPACPAGERIVVEDSKNVKVSETKVP